MTDYDEHMPLQSIYQWEKECPDTIYMTQPMGEGEIRTYTFKETVDEARRMAAYLRAQKFPPGSRIAILSKNCAEFIITDLAVWMAGHVTVALFPTLEAKTVNYILTHSETSLLFLGKLDAWDEMKPGVPEDIPIVAYTLSPSDDHPKWGDIIAETDPIKGSPTRAADDTALLIYTSGSTGQPKGVEISFKNMAFASKGVSETFSITQDDRQLSYLPLAHALERAAVENLSLNKGSQVFFAESLDTFVRDLRRARPTVFISVPRLWLKFQLGVFSKMPPKKLKRLLKIPIVATLVRKKILKGLGLDACRYAISGSAPIPPELIQWYRDLGLELLEAYGMTENFAFSHINFPGKTRVGYVGNCWPDVEHKIDANGEILIRSDATMKGYYEMPEETAKCITKDGFLRTGDRGEIDEEGRLKITGRVKELFKTSKGKYVAPVPIENLINADPHVEQSCVLGSGHPQPAAVVLLSEELRSKIHDPSVRDETTQALAELLKAVNSELPGYERLQFLAVAKDGWLIENGFLTPTMKIKRNVLDDTYVPQLDGWYESREKVIWEG